MSKKKKKLSTFVDKDFIHVSGFYNNIIKYYILSTLPDPPFPYPHFDIL